MRDDKGDQTRALWLIAGMFLGAVVLIGAIINGRI